MPRKKKIKSEVAEQTQPESPALETHIEDTIDKRSAAIEKALMAKYLRGGREYPNLDCFGICRYFRREAFGKGLPEFAGGGELAALYGLRTKIYEMENNKTVRRLPFPVDGCFVQMKSEQGRPTHCGIWLTGGKILHIDADPRGARIEKDIDLRDRIIAYWDC